MKHFEFRTVPADQWRRIKGTNPKGTDCDRPHFVPVSRHGFTFAALAAFGACGRCLGLQPRASAPWLSDRQELPKRQTATHDAVWEAVRVHPHPPTRSTATNTVDTRYK